MCNDSRDLPRVWDETDYPRTRRCSSHRKCRSVRIRERRGLKLWRALLIARLFARAQHRKSGQTAPLLHDTFAHVAARSCNRQCHPRLKSLPFFDERRPVTPKVAVRAPSLPPFFNELARIIFRVSTFPAVAFRLLHSLRSLSSSFAATAETEVQGNPWRSSELLSAGPPGLHDFT
jgi:hypothetical protein